MQQTGCTYMALWRSRLVYALQFPEPSNVACGYYFRLVNRDVVKLLHQRFRKTVTPRHAMSPEPSAYLRNAMA